MKRTICFLLVVAAVVFCGAQPYERVGAPELRKLFTAQAAALVTFGGERYFLDRKAFPNVRTILALHDWKDDPSVQKFTDGTNVVLSFPIVDLVNVDGYCRYIWAYNSRNLEEADALIVRSRYREALELYRLLLHFDPCDYGQSKLRPRIKLTESIISGTGQQATLEELKKMFETIPPPWETNLHALPAEQVSSLTTVLVKKLAK